MKICPACGASFAEGHVFCGRCGISLVAEEKAYSPEDVLPENDAGAEQTLNYRVIPPAHSLSYKNCGKCGRTEKGDTMFCEACGTRMFTGATRATGKLILVLAGCELSFRAVGMGTLGALYVYDDRIIFRAARQADYVADFSAIDEVSMEMAVRGTISLRIGGRNALITLSGKNIDSAQYLMELIQNNR